MNNDGKSPTGTVPPLNTVEGVMKAFLGLVAGLLLLYAVWQSIETRTPVQRQVLYILGGCLVAFLGVDVWSVIQRMKVGNVNDSPDSVGSDEKE